MADLIGAGSAGLGRFRVDRATGAVHFDPLASESWPEDAVTETRLAVLVRDATGALALAEVAVDVTGPASVPTYVTDGMTATATWDVVGAYYDELTEAREASARVSGSRASGEEGILMEAGGRQSGLLLYVYDDTLYFRCGAGDDSSDSGFVDAPAPTGDFVVEWSASATTGKLALYVDGALVDTSTFTFNKICGGNVGSLGVAAEQVVTNLGGWGNDQGAFEGTASEAIIYLDQITAEVEA
ncbi:hypothetical protein SAMN05444336_112129 [Albimonas donghaensis]|uniref:Concanavalin A-like lectin/glucanases superfamily protein n=1 Tax=Albimonas donghaensis TaxID=356660 RepID=A0A1H3FI91_9RHOB|nr:hypothetical protein [Albimonas donghaensis]SDX90650.1 hypothetical protein SAMN05444336_112129 [Albimonas donghaensis]